MRMLRWGLSAAAVLALVAIGMLTRATDQSLPPIFVFDPLDQEVIDMAYEARRDAIAASELLPQVKHARRLGTFAENIVRARCGPKCSINWTDSKVVVVK